MRVLFMTKEQERIIQEARWCPLVMGAPLIDQVVIDSELPLTRPDYDFNTARGKEHLKVYHHIPLAGLKGVAG